LALAALLLLTPAHPARADDPAERREPFAPKTAGQQDKDNDQKHWFQKLADAVEGHERDEHERAAPAVLDAFRATVRYPATCMVRVVCDDEQVALGTIVDAAGYIATKGSELRGAVTCLLGDGSRYRARIVGVDRGSDLALLKIPAQNLPAITWSDSDPPAVGGWVITPGLDEVPRAIGIVSVSAHPVRGGVLGIQMTEDQPGPRVIMVVPGSGAAAAGLTRGDIVTHVGDESVRTSDDMVATTSNLLPGDTIELSVLRDDRNVRIAAVLGSVADTLSSHRTRFQEQLGSALSKRRFLFPLALEHDTPLDPRDCGGVIVNLEGEAIGVNVARANRIASYAIPAGTARPILEQLRSRDSQADAGVPVSLQLSETGHEQ
jgi:serine protease Do